MDFKTTKKQLVFTTRLLELAEVKSKQLGISFPEYVRHLIVEDTKNILTTIPLVDMETEEAIGRSLKDYAEGRYTTLRSDEEVETHFKKLSKEAENE